MSRLRVHPLAALLPLVALAAAAAEPSASDAEFFESRVRPLLVEHCGECHSRRAGDPEGGLSFDSRADFLAAEGVATAGEPDASLLVQVIRYDGDLQMPPAGRLPNEAIATLEDWVRRGLPWPADGPAVAADDGFDIAGRKASHWCWQPPRRVPPPDVSNAAWCRGDIDRFILARLDAAGLRPAAEAPREVLARRAAAFLTGLPPDPREVEALCADTDPRAFDRYVDDLLASPHYGERFARHWLDVVRYGESRGHEFDFPIPNAWRYRDWVVQAFNADLPYDQFVREQIAGDLVDQPRLDPQGADLSVVGTGFWYLGEEVHSPVDVAQDDADRIDNKVDTFGKAFLGLALGCARCHDHKFDAISNEDYYAIAGMLMSSSYRQVPYESLVVNRDVAERLAAADRAARRDLLPLVADLVAPLADAVAGLLPAAAPAAAPVSAEVVIADYSRPGGTPIIRDAAAWGPAPRPAAGVALVAAEGDRPAAVRLTTDRAATSDAVWATTRTVGEREPGAIGGIDRAGRVLRTPKVRLEQGVIWHRVRGHLQIFTVVDSHVLLVGPLYGATTLTVDTQGQWQWVRQELTSDLKWEPGHVVHVEYAAVSGAAEVQKVVAAPDRPVDVDPLAAAVAAHGGDRGAAAAALHATVVSALRDGSLAERDDAAALAALANALLASPACDWTTPAARELVERTTAAAATREAIAATVRLESAIAPAILDGNGLDQFVLLKGSAARRGAVAPRRFLEAIDGPAQPTWPAHASGRRELAERVLDPANPLTARVLVNRVWHHLFGRGLVATPDNFGALGEPPTDPLALALLDSLATRFREEGWSVKRLVREIVTSATWRMNSAVDPDAQRADPLDLLLHHYPLRRLEGEAVRDAILTVSGRLDRTLGGPSVEVFLTDFQEGRGRPSPGPLDGAGRRSLYTRVRRNFLPGFLVAFDMPVPFQAMGRRNVTNVPAQALTLMNDPFVREQSTLWARRTLADASSTPATRIERMYREAFARPPRPDELEAVLGFLADQARLHGVDFAAHPADEAVWTDLAHALINAKEFIFVP